MQKIIIYTVLMIFTFVGKAFAQEKTFEQRAKAISIAIENITKEEKNALKLKIEAIDKQVEEGKISTEIAKEQKQKAAEATASILEIKLAEQEAKLTQLVQDKVDGKMTISDTVKKSGGTIIVIGGSGANDSIGENKKEINLTGLKIYNGEKDKMERLSRRTTSQFVFAMGLNNLITKGENIENSDYKTWGSHFYEWGFTYNTRIFKNNNLLHAKYGFSVMYNNLRPTDNRFFVKNGNQTNLETSVYNLSESRLRNVQLVFPAHLEFDFSPKKTNKKGENYFRTHKAFRFAIGGYGGFNIKSKQILKYKIDGDRVKEKIKNDFNTSDFIYGISTYIGYKETCLYFKYDLNPLFKNNSIDQNNISLGIRFDFN